MFGDPTTQNRLVAGSGEALPSCTGRGASIVVHGTRAQHMRQVTMTDLAAEPTDITDESNDKGADGNDNLLGELARAMHAAATSQYERMNADLERRRTEQVAAIAARASSEAESLKASSEQDIAAIDAWAKAETEKIKHERLRRIDTRREQLAAELERQETIRQREIFAIEVAIDAHRGEIDQFFGRMERETDPTAIARVAASLPPFPSLTDIADEARRGASVEFASLDAEVGTNPAPELEAAAPGEAPAAPEPVAASSDGATDGLDESMADGTVSESRLMAVMDPEATQGGNTESTEPWEAPHAVSVAAGSSGPEAPAQPEPHGRVGATLLRTVRAIRPMAGSDKDDTTH